MLNFVWQHGLWEQQTDAGSPTPSFAFISANLPTEVVSSYHWSVGFGKTTQEEKQPALCLFLSFSWTELIGSKLQPFFPAKAGTLEISLDCWGENKLQFIKKQTDQKVRNMYMQYLCVFGFHC